MGEPLGKCPRTGACEHPPPHRGRPREQEEQGSWLSLGLGQCRTVVASGGLGGDGWRRAARRDLQGGCSEAAGPPPRLCFRVTKAARARCIPSGGQGGGEKGRKGGRGEHSAVLGAMSFPPHSLTRKQERDHPSPQLEPCHAAWFLLSFSVCGLLAASEGPLKQRNVRGPRSSVYAQLCRHPGRLRPPF